MSKDIVEVEGRKPFNANKLRLARGDHIDGQTDVRTPGYISWQSKINIGPGGTIDDDVLEDYLNGVGSVYEEVEPSEIDKIPSGSRIAYITKTNKWRSAGWLSSTEVSYEDINGNKFDKQKKYVLYKAYNNACFPVQVEDVEMFYVMKQQTSEPIVKMIYFKQPKRKTNFPVELKDAEGNKVVVYYAKDNFQRDKIKKLNKYKKALQDPEGWEFEEGGQICNIED